MGMRENWQKFVDLTQAKADGHMKTARYWNMIHQAASMFLILLGAVTTALALIKGIPTIVLAGIAGTSTLVSTVLAFLKPHERQSLQSESSKEFRILMLKMVRCETETEYEGLWKQLNDAIVGEPFVPKRYAPRMQIEWTMTPELDIIITEKEREVEEALAEDTEEKATPQSKATMDDIDSAGNEYESDDKAKLLGDGASYKNYDSVS